MIPKVLHFEDELDLTTILAAAFKNVGLDYVSYGSPAPDPVAIVLKEKPDLIITDIMMPGMDGIEATKLLKADKRTANIMVLGFSNLPDKDITDEFLAAGVFDYLLTSKTTPNDIAYYVRGFFAERSA
jgi:two-component system cell cycle response regulator DivK